MADELRDITDEEINAASEAVGNVEIELTPEQQEEIRETVRELSNANTTIEERENLIEESVKNVVEEASNDVLEPNVITNEQNEELAENVVEVPVNVALEDALDNGDIVTLAPEIADNIDNYDPSDVYRVESINDGMAKLSRNGKEVPELSYIPVSMLTKSDFVSTVSDVTVSEDSVNGNVEENELEDEVSLDNSINEAIEDEVEEKEEIIAVEKGSKPIRWARHFIDKVKQNVSVAGITQKLETSIEKDKEKTEEVEDLNLNGQITSFKTSLLSTELKIAKKASNRWNKITGWFKKDKVEEEPVVENTIEQNKVVEENEVVENEQQPKLDDATENIVSSEKPYDIFKDLPEERKAAVLEDLVNGLFFQKQMLEEKENLIAEQEEKLTQAEEALENSKGALEKATDTIEKLNHETKNNEIIEENENVEENGNTSNLNVANNENSISETVNSGSGIDWDDPIVKQELEANKLAGISNEKKYTKEEKKDALKAGKAKLKVKTTFTDEERKADEERRKTEYETYDRERQAEVEAFWQNQAAYVGSDEYVQLANERATEHLERQNKINAEIDALEQEKRDALIKENNRQAALNRIKSNLILDAYNDEQIMALDQIGNVDKNEQGFHR